MEIAAIVISVCAIALSIYEAVQTRQHHRISVRPSLFLQAERDEGAISIRLHNSGLGPAVITGSSLEFEANHYDVSVSGWDALHDAAGGLVQSERLAIGNHSVLDAGNALPLAKYLLADGTDGSAQEALRVLVRITFRCSYSSMYEEAQPELVAHLVGPLALEGDHN